MVENNSGALLCVPCAYTHEYLFVHLVHNSNGVALQLHSGASQPAGGSAIRVDNTKGSGVAGAAYAAPGKLWGPLECPQWWLHALRSVHYHFRS